MRVFVQFSDIVGHEQEAEVHFDLGFPEMTEPCESMVVFYLAKYGLWLDLPSPEPRLVLGLVQPFSGVPLFCEVAQFPADSPVFICRNQAVVGQRASLQWAHDMWVVSFGKPVLVVSGSMQTTSIVCPAGHIKVPPSGESLKPCLSHSAGHLLAEEISLS